MADSLMKPFVLLITFIGVTILVLGSMSNLQHSNLVSGLDNVDTGMEAIAGFNYTMLNPITGADITWADTTTSLSNVYNQVDFGAKGGTTHKIFYKQGEVSTSRNVIWAYFVRNNSWDPWITSNIPESIKRNLDTDSMIVFAQKYALHGWFDIKTGVVWRFAVAPYPVINERFQGNLSTVSFMFGSENYTAFIIIGDSGNSTTELFGDNTFTLGIGQLWGDGLENIGRTSMWKLVGQLLTCSLPNTNFYANLIMTIAIWAVIAYVAIAMISRFIPTISGL